MTQRITLDESEFKRLVRGEIVTQNGLQVSLQSISHAQMFNAMVASTQELRLAMRLAGNTMPIAAFTLREDEEEIRRWVHGINQSEPCHPGDFLYQFARAVCRADCSNYPVLRPALLALKAKFPKYRFSGAL
jgi:hypothetical protein